MSQLFTPFTLRDLTFRNRVWVSPMCQYSAREGVPNDWHLVHLGSFARGGAGLVLTEATAVSPEGRISPQDTGIWTDAQRDAWRPIVDFAHRQGTPIGVQLAHAGRKASSRPPWRGRGPVPDDEGGWRPVAPGTDPYPGLREPEALDREGVEAIVRDFVAAAQRALDAGFDVLEVHAAHGYLLHQFLSPLSNHRQDEYGGSFEGRTRLLLAVVAAVRSVMPDATPLLVRISGTDWLDGGWTLEDSIRLAPLLADAGADLVDTSSGGNAPARIPTGPGYQVELSRRIRNETGVPTGAVGLITDAKQAEDVVADGSADVVLLARAMLRNPHWPLAAAHELGVEDPAAVVWPDQYLRAKPE
jgi:2,4-dienoyl-CoA reductase-like NADH-dependent reductase (Old Yellow Enzyme family)